MERIGSLIVISTGTPPPPPHRFQLMGEGVSVPGPVYMHVGKYATKLVLYLQMFLCAFHPLLKLSKKGGGLGTIILERSDFLIFANMHSIPSLSIFRV